MERVKTIDEAVNDFFRTRTVAESTTITRGELRRVIESARLEGATIQRQCDEQSGGIIERFAIESPELWPRRSVAAAAPLPAQKLRKRRLSNKPQLGGLDGLDSVGRDPISDRGDRSSADGGHLPERVHGDGIGTSKHVEAKYPGISPGANDVHGLEELRTATGQLREWTEGYESRTGSRKATG